ncbi:hypothetical protein NEIRO03_2579 [Nematocida sp. AWRm78]|nr:hypothetical protein NEIRO02_2221 [Nematocida sp. AWRm79]KAI5187713.1 hypothetical protein NEIRO03_2579 [Nematocida sp. AWRm78]
MPYSKSKITVRSCAILIVEIICTNIRLIKASMIPVNASIPTPLNTSYSQVPGGVIDPFYDINSIENKRKTILRYANNMLDASIQKYGKNTTHINNSTEQSEKDLKEKKQIEDDALEYKSITRNFELNFKDITGVVLDNYITQNWLGIGQLYWTNSYQSIVESEYFENLIQKYTINNNKKMKLLFPLNPLIKQ